MSDQAHAVLEMGASQQVGDVLHLGAGGVERQRLDRARTELVGDRRRVAERVVRRRGIEPVTPMPAAIEQDARSSREPKRRVVASATTRAGEPSACGNWRGKSRMPRTSAPRKP